MLDVAPSTKAIRFSSFVFSLSVTKTWAALVASVIVVPAITVAKAVPFTVIASASSVPSISAFPEISNVAASSSPVKVILVAPVIAPFKATAPLISIVVAAICISESATISNCPSVDELI